MRRKLNILIVSIDGVGHFNACIGIGQQLKNRGHTVTFAVPNSWKNKLSPQGFVEEWINSDPHVEATDQDKLDALPEMARKMAPAFKMSPVGRIEHFCLTLWKLLIKDAEDNEPRFKEIVAKVKPDLIIADLVMHQPSIMDAGIPWVLSMSVAPMGISDKNLPLSMLGLPTDKKYKPTWDNCLEIYKLVFHDTLENYKNWVIANGGPRLKHFHMPFMLQYSPYANIYMYPEELDYTGFRPNPKNFYRFDTFIRSSNEPFEVPESLMNKSGKLIYFSMGTIGSSEISMMKRLVAILAKSPNRFIVSKGPLSNSFELAENMWGAASVPQVCVIPMVDLVISHCGNNTLTETFYFGKPILALPLFGDQLDTAQRLHETGLGIRLHPYHSSEQEILRAIENILDDQNLAQKMESISTRIQTSTKQGRVASLIENIAISRLLIKD